VLILIDFQFRNEFEANLTKTLLNSKKINEETEIYYRNKLSKRLEVNKKFLIRNLKISASKFNAFS
jgi:hypothetical protein